MLVLESNFSCVSGKGCLAYLHLLMFSCSSDAGNLFRLFIQLPSPFSQRYNPWLLLMEHFCIGDNSCNS